MEQNLKPLELIVKLVVKTGLYFSCVDGQYHQREQQFLANYVSQLEQMGAVDDEARQMVNGVVTKTITLDDIINDTRTLFNYFSSQADRNAIAQALFNYIENVVDLDGVNNSAERQAVLAWAQGLA